MKAGTMEGLIGASNNMKLSDVPMRTYREAERKGDTATMERSMGYTGDFTKKAYEYKDKAEEELLKEQKEERKEQKIKQEEALDKRKQETKEREEKINEKTDVADSVEISDEGEKCLEQQAIGGKAPVTSCKV